MKIQTYTLEFITPCFCAGADQTVAELRGSSIRGQLRWWFRALGGSAADECECFGHVHGATPLASSFTARATILDGKEEKGWENKIPNQGMGNRTYLLGFFCGRTGRLRTSGALAPLSKAQVILSFRRPPTEKLEQAIRVFFSVGALGFRTTRAAGAFFTKEYSLTESSWTSLKDELKRANFTVGILQEKFQDWVSVSDRAGDLLKNRLRKGLNISAGRNGNSPNALGSATPRQASVLHLRPVIIDNKIRLALFEAPHSRILGPQARAAHGNQPPILKMAQLDS
jgi:CRISPR type III-B/RAMP module RAMP protein Cmr1